MNPGISVFIPAAALLVAASCASADQVQLRFVQAVDGYSTAVKLDNPGGTFPLGLYELSRQDAGGEATFEAFCIDPFQFASRSWSSYDAVAFSTFSGSSRYGSVLKLFDNAFAPMNAQAQPSGLSKAQYAAAFHLALWEIWVGDGDLQTAPVEVYGRVDTAIETQAQSFLTSLSGWNSTGAYAPQRLTVYQSATKQDFLAFEAADTVYTPSTAMPIPEADRLALLLAGFGLVGLVAGRRTDRARG